MKKVLVVLSDETLLSMFKKGTETGSLFLASDNTQALEILQSETIDLLVTELGPSGLDCAELMAAAASGSPSIKIVILLAINNLKVEDCKRLRTFKSIYFAVKPDSDKEVENFITLINVIEHQALSAENINTADFLKLIECQKKTCLLAIEQKNSSQRALVYFQQGILYDAISGLLQSEAAVAEILTWKQPQLVFRPPVQKQIRRKVFFDLDEYIDNQENNTPDAKGNSLDAMIEQLLAQAEERIKTEEAKAKSKTEPQAPVEPVAEAQTTNSDNSTPTAVNFSQLELENFLGVLRGINDYFACGIFDFSGNIVTHHAVQDFNFAILANNIAALIKNIADSTSQIGLGTSDLIQLNCDNNIVLLTFNSNHQLIAVLLLKPDSKLAGLAKLNLLTVFQSLFKL